MGTLPWCLKVDGIGGKGDRFKSEKEDDSLVSYSTEDSAGTDGGGGTRGFSGNDGGTGTVTGDVSRRLVSSWETRDSRSFILGRTKSSVF